MSLMDDVNVLHYYKKMLAHSSGAHASLTSRCSRRVIDTIQKLTTFD